MSFSYSNRIDIQMEYGPRYVFNSDMSENLLIDTCDDQVIDIVKQDENIISPKSKFVCHNHYKMISFCLFMFVMIMIIMIILSNY